MKVQFGICACLLPLSVWGYDHDQAVNNIAHDFANCAGYFSIGSVGVKAKDPDLSAQMNDMAGVALSMSADLTSEKLAIARSQMAVKSMMQDMDNDYSNFSIVLNKYAFPCRDLMQEPEKRMQYWLDKKD